MRDVHQKRVKRQKKKIPKNEQNVIKKIPTNAIQIFCTEKVRSKWLPKLFQFVLKSNMSVRCADNRREKREWCDKHLLVRLYLKEVCMQMCRHAMILISPLRCINDICGLKCWTRLALNHFTNVIKTEKHRFCCTCVHVTRHECGKILPACQQSWNLRRKKNERESKRRVEQRVQGIWNKRIVWGILSLCHL